MIRRLTEQDKAIYYELTDLFYHSEAVLHPVPLQNIENTFCEMMRSHDYMECFLFEEKETVMGYAQISRTFSQESGGIVIWVEELFIRPEYRGRGLGSAFFDFLETHYPASRYRLEVEPENKRARAMYEKLGYRELPYMQMVKESNN